MKRSKFSDEQILAQHATDGCPQRLMIRLRTRAPVTSRVGRVRRCPRLGGLLLGPRGDRRLSRAMGQIRRRKTCRCGQILS
jgi:hypothetical protein